MMKPIEEVTCTKCRKVATKGEEAISWKGWKMSDGSISVQFCDECQWDCTFQFVAFPFLMDKRTAYLEREVIHLNNDIVLLNQRISKMEGDINNNNKKRKRF